MPTKKPKIKTITRKQIVQVVETQKICTMSRLATILGLTTENQPIPQEVATRIQLQVPDIETLIEKNRVAIILRERALAIGGKMPRDDGKAHLGKTCPTCRRAVLSALGVKFLACPECGATYPAG